MNWITIPEKKFKCRFKIGDKIYGNDHSHVFVATAEGITESMGQIYVMAKEKNGFKHYTVEKAFSKTSRPIALRVIKHQGKVYKHAVSEEKKAWRNIEKAETYL